MLWLYDPDSVGLFGPPTNGDCECYCPPKFVKLMIHGDPIPLPWP